MTARRTAVLGGTTLLGKDLLERLRADRARLGIVLAESGAEEVIATPIAGEWVVSTPLMEEALEDATLVLCCGPLSPEAAAVVRSASATATVIDLAGSLGGKSFDVLSGARLSDLGPGVHASPKGASLLLAALARAAMRAGAASGLAAVACEPASELGQPAVDEMLQQAMSLLSFKPMPTEILGRQGVHDVRSPGPHGEAAEARIRREVQDLSGTDMSVLVLQPGIFHGTGVALHVPVSRGAWLEQLELEPRLSLELDTADSATPLSAVTVERAVVGRVVEGPSGCWAWAAADTLGSGAVGNVVDLIRAS